MLKRVESTLQWLFEDPLILFLLVVAAISIVTALILYALNSGLIIEEWRGFGLLFLFILAILGAGIFVKLNREAALKGKKPQKIPPPASQLQKRNDENETAEVEVSSYKGAERPVTTTKAITKRGEVVHYLAPTVLKETYVNLGYWWRGKQVELHETSRGSLIITNQRIFLNPLLGNKPVSLPFLKIASYDVSKNGLEVWKENKRHPYLFVLDPAGSEQCRQCLSRLLNEVEPTPQNVPSLDRAFCKFCGTPLPGETKYCANCGRFRSSSPPQPASARRPILSGFDIIILIIGGLFVMFFLVLIWLIGSIGPGS